MHSESSPIWISAFVTFLSHRKGWRHRQGSHPFQTLIFKNRTETKYQRTTCKYTAYSKKVSDTGQAFNYLINQLIDTKGLYHMVFLQSLFYCNDYYTAGKNIFHSPISLSSCFAPAFSSIWNVTPHLYPILLCLLISLYPSRSRIGCSVTSSFFSSSCNWKWASLFCFQRSTTLLFGSHVELAMSTDQYVDDIKTGVLCYIVQRFKKLYWEFAPECENVQLCVTVAN